jgi:hypothetical protein
MRANNATFRIKLGKYIHIEKSSPQIPSCIHALHVVALIRLSLLNRLRRERNTFLVTVVHTTSMNTGYFLEKHFSRLCRLTEKCCVSR